MEPHDTIFWLRWIITGAVTLFVVAMWFWIKRFINSIDEERRQWREQGGLVTRKWCQSIRDKCVACEHIKELQQFKKYSEGERFVSETNCETIQKEMASNINDRLKEAFQTHKEWMTQELKIIGLQNQQMISTLREQMRIEEHRTEMVRNKLQKIVDYEEEHK